ncbi:MAG: 3-methyl-2-oxobutanoate hydroxymethyltransferase [Planctomycetota bacterium]|nr:MAG: 3-methyl-2-oxobutanoate hydroxymethyltransferase [Planctomycetota bacterium]
MSESIRPMTVPRFLAKKRRGEKITMLTAYDYPTAALLDQAGVDSLLVGDSLGMVVQGRENTLPVTLDQIIYHAEMVARAARRALVVADMPFLSYQLGRYKAIENAGRILKETACQAVKLEGGEEQAELIAALSEAGIPVMAHVGLRPQSVRVLGGYRIERDREKLLADARAVEQAGAFAVVLECIPAEIAAEITQQISIPTIGIGAGAGCDGQVLVVHDLLQWTPGERLPKHAKAYADLKTAITQAVSQFCRDVQEGAFPGPDQVLE